MLAPLGHSKIQEEGTDKWFVDEASRHAADCVNDGSHDEYTECGRCHAHLDQRTVTDPATGHDYELRVVDTCFIYYHCPNCHSGYASYSIHTHEMQEFTEALPTCVSDGHKSYYRCGRCGKKYDYDIYNDSNAPVERSDEELLIPALDHSYGAWEMIEEPDANHTGTEMCTCSQCDAVMNRDMGIDVTYDYTMGEGS